MEEHRENEIEQLGLHGNVMNVEDLPVLCLGLGLGFTTMGNVYWLDWFS